MILICNAFAQGCTADWDGLGALATTGATFAALIVAWAEPRRRKQARREVIREACSAVDRLVAYHAIAKRLITFDPIYVPQLRACDRIAEDASIQSNIIDILMHRAELSDGAIMALVAAKSIVPGLLNLKNPYGLGSNEWQQRRIGVDAADMSASIAAEKSASVRKHYRWPISTAAAAIASGYNAMLIACEEARANNTVPVFSAVDQATC